jgi:type VI secretion system protein ImpE
MEQSLEHYRAGQLDRAISASAEHLKNKPGDVAERVLLCELLCFAGELERADKHLDLINQQDPRGAAAVSLFRQLIRAETARQQFFTDGRAPELVVEPDEDTRARLAASVRIREGAAAEAAELLEGAESKRARPRGTCDGRAFDDFRDLDDLTAGVFEVLTSTGKYFWVPVGTVRELEIHPPKCVRDLLWRQAHMVVDDGPDGEVYLPALYAGSQKSDDPRVRLGRETQWTGAEGAPVRGAGQRMFLVGDAATGMGDVGAVQFERPEGVA